MMKELELLKTELKLRGFSPMTVRNYSFFVDKFIQFSNKSSDILAEEDVKHYLSSLIETKSKSTTMLAAAAIKFFFAEVLKKQLTNIKLPKQDKRLPDVLTKEEVKVLIDTADTTKSRLMLSLLYSSGLRVSELVNLKSQDIRFEENIGWVRGGKGGKDRMFLLSGKITEELNSYIKNHAQDYLFSKDKPLTTRNIQKIVKRAREKSGIQKKITPHTMRHSFATHLLEQGVDIRKIQILLGHANLNTTQLYSHVSTAELKKIISPLDNL